MARRRKRKGKKEVSEVSKKLRERSSFACYRHFFFFVVLLLCLFLDFFPPSFFLFYFPSPLGPLLLALSSARCSTCSPLLFVQYALCMQANHRNFTYQIQRHVNLKSMRRARVSFSTRAFSTLSSVSTQVSQAAPTPRRGIFRQLRCTLAIYVSPEECTAGHIVAREIALFTTTKRSGTSSFPILDSWNWFGIGLRSDY